MKIKKYLKLALFFLVPENLVSELKEELIKKATC